MKIECGDEALRHKAQVKGHRPTNNMKYLAGDEPRISHHAPLMLALLQPSPGTLLGGLEGHENDGGNVSELG